MIAKGKPETTSPRSITASSTAVFLVGLTVTYLALPSNSAVDVFRIAAVGIGVSLVTATVVEGMSGVRALIRVDILMLWVLYGLTFLEFLFPQPNVGSVLSPDMATNGTTAAMVGFAGLAIGRHFVPYRYKNNTVSFADVSPRNIFLLFITAATIGYSYIFFSVNFDLLEMLRQMGLPRFEQSWGRGRFGDAYALWVEVGALLYLVPPLAGLIFARHKGFGAAQKSIVAIVLMLTFYYGFSTGARNILAVYVITFFGAYYLNKPGVKLWQVTAQGIVIVLLLLLVTSYMLEFRNSGISNSSFSDYSPDTLYIDHNMVVLSRLTNVFPATYDFLGLEIPYNALIHPIPRVLWPEKPEGLSVTVESIVGVRQATIACTFVGEAYMMAGMLGVVLVSIVFGAAAEMWNHLNRDTSSAFSLLLYASGFFCAAISMRSLLWVSVTMLPTLALWLYGKMFVDGASPARPRSTV
jgi:oligosaccharide repeat unit polymerase